MKIEKFEMMSRERNLERKSSRGGSSSGKRTRDSQVESINSATTRGRWQGPTMESGFRRVLQSDKVRKLNARTAINTMLVLADD